MTVEQVLSGVSLQSVLPPDLASTQVGGLAYDSRQVGERYLFFAFPGARADGRTFAQAAVDRGAIAVLSELRRPDGFSSIAPWLPVEHGRQALATAGRNFYRIPDEKLGVTGVTGTNGKTTTTYLIDSILRAAGSITAMIGTIEYHLAGKVLPAVNTTPESLDVFRILDELLLEAGPHPAFATMEVSSHALALGRVYGFRFHTAVFTNLTRDHLDFHETMENYFAAKRLLFESNGGRPPLFAVINRDDDYGKRIKPASETEAWWYGLGPDANLRARHIDSSFKGLKFDIQTGKQRIDISSSLIGKINVYNILAAVGAALSYGVSPDVIARGIKQCHGIPGRFERVDEGQPFAVVVDYSHTDDALRNALTVARGLGPKRIVTVFGCGGDRDRTKRPLMGKVAGELSDFVILTSDNPRSEDPLQIMNDANVGLQRTESKHVFEPDREAAIRRAIEEARAGDFVLIAGKGHETYQIFKDRTIHFDDREVARHVLKEFGYPKPS
jgi:UDP-N-acetylmuramoyl-L-alanyl-D-glutamate--2,6-diaminopimelate ligase